MPDALPWRNEILGIRDRGLALRIDKREVVAAWSAILRVGAVLSFADLRCDRLAPVLVLGIVVDGEERLLLVAKADPMWDALISTLPGRLPGMRSTQSLDAELAAVGKASLYDRAGRLQ